MKITEREKAVLDFIGSFHEKHGHGPSIREICAGIGLKSPGSLHKVIKRLEEKGLLHMSRGRNRTLRLTSPLHGKRIPLIGRIAAGTPIEANEELLEELSCDPGVFGVSECFALVVKGDSLIEKQIRPGDIAILRPTSEVENGEIGAVMVEGLFHEATLKIVKQRNGTLELHSANPLYPPLIFSGNDRVKVRIVGKLVGIIRRFQ